MRWGRRGMVPLPPSGALQVTALQRAGGLAFQIRRDLHSTMSVLISDNETVFIYNSVTGRPVCIEAFGDSNEAEAFVVWAMEAAGYEELRDNGEALRDWWGDNLRDQWEKDFYEPIFRAEQCPLCGKPLGNETQVHKACTDYEAMQADLVPGAV